MKQRVEDIYFKELGIDKVVSPKARMTRRVFIILILIAAVLESLSAILFLNYAIVIVILSLVIFFILSRIYDTLMIKRMKDDKDIDIESKKWHINNPALSKEIYLLTKHKFENYLKELKLCTPAKLRKLIEAYQKDAERLTFRFPIKSTVFVVLFTAVWSTFISWLFNSTESFNIKNFLEIIYLILLITICLGFLKATIGHLFSQFLNSRRNKILSLCSLLEDIELDMFINHTQDKKV